MKLLRLFQNKNKPKYFYQFFHGQVRGLLGWVPENGKNMLVLELECCNDRWNWERSGLFRFQNLKDLRAVLDDLTKVIESQVRNGA